MADQHVVFVAGATGAMGLAAVEALRAAGHDVIGVTRSDEGAQLLEALGARAVRVNLFDAAAVAEAMRGASAVVHFATKVPEGASALKPGAWTMNDRLRREGTQHLLAGAEQQGIRRFIFESLALAYPSCGDTWIDESVDLAPHTKFMRSVVDAEGMLSEFGRRGGAPVSLRYSRIYGPGRASDTLMRTVMKRGMPILGNGENFVSSIHIDDVGSSVVAALEVAPGVYNVSDDRPVPQRDHLGTLANALLAPSPRQIPYPVARMMMGNAARALTASQRVSAARFKAETGWAPRFPSVEEGWPNAVRRSGLVPQVVAR